MEKNRLFLCVAVAFLLITVGFLSAQTESLASCSLITVEVKTDGGTEEIKSWVKEDVQYVFLPSYAELSHVQIKLTSELPVKINGKEVTDYLNCEEFQLGVTYELKCIFRKKEYWGAIIFLRSDNVAAMYIDTDSGSMDYIHEKKGNKESGRISIYTAEGKSDYAGELLSLNGRGNNTWESFEKKPYSLKLTEEASLLNMGAASRWILLANADDPSHMRNKIVYDFSGEIGLPYSPESQWVDLYLNGEYSGLYLLCERNELHKERIDISQTGSFVVSLERLDRLMAQNYPYIETKQNQTLRIHYPIDAQDNEYSWIENTFQSIENAILGDTCIDEMTGKSLWELIDLNSWAMKYLIEEIFASGDACFISQFFYLDGEEDPSKVYAGPVWDFDHSLGTRVAWALTEPQSMYANRLYVKDGFDRPWFHSLYENDTFFSHMLNLFESEYLPLLQRFIDYDIPGYSERIMESARMNNIRWNVESNGGIAERKEITDFLSDRINFLNSIWLDEREYHLVKLDQGFGGFYGYFAVYAGEHLQNVPEFEDTDYQTFCGWYYSDTNEPFDITKPITEDIEIYAKWQDRPSKKTEQVLKLVPLGVVAVFGFGLLVLDVRKSRRS